MPAPSAKPAVLHVIEAFEGGSGRHVCELLPELAARGYPIALAASFRRNPPFANRAAHALAAHGITIHELPMRRAISPLADLMSMMRLRRLIQALKPDIIHTHSSKAGFLGRLAGAAQRIPLVHTPHAFAFLMRESACQKKLYRALERFVQPKTSALIAVSQEEACAAQGLGFTPDRIHHIPNGSRYPSIAASAGTAQHAVGFFGRLSRQKGVDVLLRAAADVDATIDIHGGGGQEAALRRQCQRLRIAPRIRFMGECLQGDVVAYMQKYALLVIPSRWEGCPYVVLDAWAAGVPVVATRVGGLPDLIRDGVNGILVPANDAPALSSAITTLLRDPPRRHALALAAQASLAHYTLGQMVERIEAVYGGVGRRV